MRLALVVAVVMACAAWGTTTIAAPVTQLVVGDATTTRVYDYDISISASQTGADADAPSTPYYRWNAAVAVTSRCSVGRRGASYSTVQLIEADSAPECSVLYQHFCVESQRTAKQLAAYAIGIEQNGAGEITRIDVQPPAADAAAAPVDDAMMTGMIRAFVRPLSTFLPNATQFVSARRTDRVSGDSVAYDYALESERDAVAIEKRQDLGVSVDTHAMSRGEVTERVAQHEVSRTVVVHGVRERIDTEHTLLVSAKYQNGEWKDMTTVTTRSTLLLRDDGAAATDADVRDDARSDEMWQSACAAGAVDGSDEDAVLMQMGADEEEHEYVQADVIDSDEQEEADTPQRSHERVVSSDADAAVEMIPATYADEQQQDASAAPVRPRRSDRKGRRTGANAWGGLNANVDHGALRFASVAEAEQLLGESVRVEGENAAAAATKENPTVQDVAQALQKLNGAFKSLDALTEHVVATRGVATDADTRAQQIVLAKKDAPVCTRHWSKLFIAMSAKSEGGSGAASGGGMDALTSGGAKVSQSGLLFMLTEKLPSSTPAAADSSKGETYPSEVNIESVIDSITLVIAQLADESEYPAELRADLRLADGTSAFGKLRSSLTKINSYLSTAKAAVRAPSTGVTAAFADLRSGWYEVVSAGKLTATANCEDAATLGRVTKAAKLVSNGVMTLNAALSRIGGALAQARAEARAALPDGRTAELLKLVGVLSYRVEKSFGDAAMVRATVFSEVAAQIGGTQASVSVSAGVHAEALGRKGSILELSFQPTLSTANPRNVLSGDAAPKVTIMGISLTPSSLSPYNWLNELAPRAMRRVAAVFTEADPLFKELAQTFSAMVRDPNMFGGAFFRPPTIRPVPLPVTGAAVPTGSILGTRRTSMRSRDAAFVEAAAELHAEDHATLHQLVLDAAVSDNEAERVAGEALAEVEADAEADAERRSAMESGEGLLLRSGARLRSSVRAVPEDKTHAMFFRALKTVITTENANGELVALNEKTLPSYIPIVMQYAELFQAITTECTAAGIPAQAEQFGKVGAWFNQIGGDLVSRLWSGVGTWASDKQPSPLDAQLRAHFGGPKAPEEIPAGTASKTAEWAGQGVAKIGKGSARGGGNSRRRDDAGPPAPVPTGTLGPLLTLLKDTPAVDSKLRTLVTDTARIYELIKVVLAGAGDLVAGADKRDKYVGAWADLSKAFTTQEAGAKAVSDVLLAAKPAVGTPMQLIGAAIDGDRARLTTLSALCGAIQSFLQSTFVALPAKWATAAGAYVTFLSTQKNSDATVEGWTAVDTFIDGTVNAQLKTLFTTWLAEGRGAHGKADTRMEGLFKIMKSTVTMLKLSAWTTQSMFDLAGAVRTVNQRANVQDAISGISTITGMLARKSFPEWSAAASDLMALADSVDFHPNRWMTSIGTARDALNTLGPMLEFLNNLSFSQLIGKFTSAAEPSSGPPSASSPSLLTCMGPRDVDWSSRGRKTIFSRDFNLLSVQLGPFPVGPVSVVVGLGLNVHTHLDFEYGLCQANGGDSGATHPSQKTTQIAVVSDLAAKLVGDVSVGVGVPFLSMGVQIAITFLDVHLPAHTYIDTQQRGMAVWGKPFVEALAGEVRAYVDIFIRFAVTIYKWGGVRYALPNSAMCWQSNDELAICPPADAWAKRANVMPSGLVASPQVRPANSGKCVACNYVSAYWTTRGYWTCPLTPRRFAAVAGFAAANTIVPRQLLEQIRMTDDLTEFMAVCQESYNPLSIAEYSLGPSKRRGTYSATVCVQQFAGTVAPGGVMNQVRAFRVMHGASSGAEAFTSMEKMSGSEYDACAAFSAKHATFTNGLKPREGASYWRKDDIDYAGRVQTLRPRFQLSMTPSAMAKDGKGTLPPVPFLQLAKAGTKDYTTPLPNALRNDGSTRTGMCIRCRNTLEGEPSATYECPLHGRRAQLFAARASVVGTSVALYARKQMAALADLMYRKNKALPQTDGAFVYLCDEWAPKADSRASDGMGGYLFVRDPANPPTMSYPVGMRYLCAVVSGAHKCELIGGLTSTAYDQQVLALQDKTYEYMTRVQHKQLPCRPAPVRVHRPSDKLKASGVCVWCKPDGATALECGLTILTDKSKEVAEINSRRFGPLEIVNPKEFASLALGMNRFASVGWAAIRRQYPVWPVIKSDDVTHIALCDEQVLVDSQSTRPVVTFDVSSVNNPNGEKFKIEYVFTWAATIAGGAKVTNTVQKSWPALMALDAALRSKYSEIELPEFPSNGDPFLVAFGLAGGDPDDTLKATRMNAMKAYFEGVSKMQTIWTDYTFASFFGFDAKMPSDGTIVSAYLCANIDNSLADCVKIESKLSPVLAFAGAREANNAPVTIDRVTGDLTTSNVKADKTAPYFFQKQVMDAIAAADSTMANRRCDAMPPGMQADSDANSTPDYVD